MTKKAAWWALGLFVAFFLITQPNAAADTVKMAANGIGNGFDAMITFLVRLF